MVGDIFRIKNSPYVTSMTDRGTRQLRGNSISHTDRPEMTPTLTVEASLSLIEMENESVADAEVRLFSDLDFIIYSTRHS